MVALIMLCALVCTVHGGEAEQTNRGVSITHAGLPFAASANHVHIGIKVSISQVGNIVNQNFGASISR